MHNREIILPAFSPSAMKGYMPSEVMNKILSYLLPEQIGLLLFVSIDFSLFIPSKETDALWNTKRATHFPDHRFYINGNPAYQQFVELYNDVYKPIPIHYRQLFSVFKEPDGDRDMLDNVEIITNQVCNIFSGIKDKNNKTLYDITITKKDQRIFNYNYNQYKKLFFKTNHGLIDVRRLDTSKVLGSEKTTILHLAISLYQPLSEIKYLVEVKGSNLNHPCMDSYSPLHMAVAFGSSLEIIEYLLQKASQLLNKKTRDNETPFIYACMYGKIKIAEYLIKQKEIDLTAFTISDDEFNNYTALHWAAYNGYGECVKLLLDHDQNQEYFPKQTIIDVFFIAANSGHFHINEMLIERFPQFRLHLRRDGGKKSILLHACECGNPEFVNYLLSNFPLLLTQKINPSAAVFHAAINGGSVEVLKAVIENFNTTIKDGKNIMFIDAYLYSIGILKMLEFFLNNYPELLNEKNNDGHTALIKASATNKVDAVSYLLSKENINILVCSIKNGWSALHWAANRNHHEVVDQLLQHKSIVLSEALREALKQPGFSKEMRAKLELFDLISNNKFTQHLFGQSKDKKLFYAKELLELACFSGSKHDYYILLEKFKQHDANKLTGQLKRIYSELKLFLDLKTDDLLDVEIKNDYRPLTACVI